MDMSCVPASLMHRSPFHALAGRGRGAEQRSRANIQLGQAEWSVGETERRTCTYAVCYSLLHVGHIFAY
jgi:hypothetical protein